MHIYIGLLQLDPDAFLRKIAPYVGLYLCIDRFVTYLNRRMRYLDQAEVQQLRKIPNEHDKINMLLTCLLKLKGIRAPLVKDVILSLMDSYEDSDGGQTLLNHWTLMQRVLNTGVLYICNIIVDVHIWFEVYFIFIQLDLYIKPIGCICCCPA